LTGPIAEEQERESTSTSPIAPRETDAVADQQGHMPAQLRQDLAPYAQPDLRRALISLATSVLPYLLLSFAMWRLLDVSLPLVLLLAVPTAGFLIRAFIVFHDCAHGSFVASRRWNVWLGRSIGLFLYVPYLRWRHDHAVHHATSGDLERRGTGDVPTLTIEEYRERSWRGRLGYRLFRNPLVMFGLGPIVAMIIGPRIVAKNARPRMRRSVIGTNFSLAVVVALACWLMGVTDYLLVVGPAALLAGAGGIWLFYVQHQFEDAYWAAGGNWSYADAALRGSSFLNLPPVLRFFTGNIGYHHVHHLNARIPSYNLKRAHDENEIFQSVPTMSLWGGVRATRFKLWDEERGQLVTFAAARRAPASANVS
jgi:omega-6 fatty acid desaturase (delta-12 desaturase)